MAPQVMTIFFGTRQPIVKLVGWVTHLAEGFLAHGYSSCVRYLKQVSSDCTMLSCVNVLVYRGP